MEEKDYTKRELDAKFDNFEEKMKEGFNDVMRSIESVKNDQLAPILIQTKLTNGRVNGLETREAERRGGAKWMLGVGLFLCTVLVSYLGWLGLQVTNIHEEVQKAVTDALIPYAK